MRANTTKLWYFTRERFHLTTKPWEQKISREDFRDSQLSWIKLTKLLGAPAWITAQEEMKPQKMALL